MHLTVFIAGIFIFMVGVVKLAPLRRSENLQPWIFLIEPALIFAGSILASFNIIKIEANDPAFKTFLSISIVWIGISLGMEFRWDMFRSIGKKRMGFSLIESSVTFLFTLVILRLLDFSMQWAVIAAAAASTSHRIAPFVKGTDKTLYSPFDWFIAALVVWIIVFRNNTAHGILMPLLGIALGLLYNFAFGLLGRRWIAVVFTLIFAFFLAFLASNLWISPLLLGIFVGLTIENTAFDAKALIEIEKTLDVIIRPAYFTLLLVAGMVFVQYFSEMVWILLAYWAARGSVKLALGNGDWVLLPQGWFTISIAAESFLRGETAILPMVVFAVMLNNLLAFLFASLPEIQ